MTSLASTTELDQLTITIVVDNATDTLSSINPGMPQLPEIAYLLGSVPPTGEHDGHNCVVVFDQLCVACHGFSALATARQGDRTATVLFDVGPYGEVWLANAARLAVDLSSIDVLFLSHWHWDHSGGITTVVAAIAAARERAGRVGSSSTSTRTGPTSAASSRHWTSSPCSRPSRRSTPSKRRAATSSPMPTCTSWTISSSPAATSRARPATKPASQATTPGATTTSPLTPPSTTSASSPPACAAGERRCSPCSHAGVVNVGLEARRLLPDQPVDLLLGGYHLAGAAVEDRIEPTVHDLTNLVAPRIVAPGHCTGWRAAAALANAFSPTGYAPSVVGTRYLLDAAS